MNLLIIIYLLGIFFTCLYPFAVRQIPLSAFDQTLARLGIFSIFSAIILIFYRYNTWSSIFKYPIWIIAIVNAISTITSYISYQKINIGTSVTTYFIYPIFLLLFGVIFNKIKINIRQWFVILLSFAGVVICHWNDLFIEKVELNRNYWIGLISIIISSITSAIVIYYYHSRKLFKHTTEYLYNVYTIPFILFLFIFAYQYLFSNRSTSESASTNNTTEDQNTVLYKINNYLSNISNFNKTIFFNIFIGFVGYFLMYYSFPKLPLFLVSLFSYSGIWMTILLDKFLLNIPLSLWKIIGSGLVILSNVLYEIN
jgi:drug/metabolite transporter (DMT)-like permease